MSFSLRLDQTVVATATWVDQHGNPIGPPPNLTATVSDPSVATATVQADGTILLTPLAQTSTGKFLTVTGTGVVNPAVNGFSVTAPLPPPTATTGSLTFGAPTPA